MIFDFLLYLVLAFLVLDFFVDLFFEILNFNHRLKPLPDKIQSLFSIETNQKQLNYQKDNFRFGIITGSVSSILIIFVVAFKILPQFDYFLRLHIVDEYALTFAFFGVLFFLSFIFSIPLDWYQTFVIEEKYGFNKTSYKLFFMDKLKSLILTILLGGLLLFVLLWFYFQTLQLFWLFAWVFMSLFSVFISLFYSNLIVPLFNKQKPIEEGSLKDEILAFCKKVDFKLKDVYVIDSSKRSTKTNAYFTGFGPKKRIVLYDGMIEKFSKDEIVAVLAHEIGHYKHRHTLWGLITSLISSGISLFLLGLLMNHPVLSKLLGNDFSSFHMSILAFALLYSPVDLIITPLSSILSRRHEFQADAFAARYGYANALKLALVRLTGDNLSNLNPHPFYVWFHYSHPPVIARIERLERQ